VLILSGYRYEACVTGLPSPFNLGYRGPKSPPSKLLGFSDEPAFETLKDRRSKPLD